MAAGGAAGDALAAEAPPEKPAEKPAPEPDHVGCLVDTTLCIGCRQCEAACNTRNRLPKPDQPFTDRTVFRQARRPTETTYTVVNEYPGSPSPDQSETRQTYAKIQCMHCLTPSCVSACIVGAMSKSSDGAVVYNPDICLGCRYCQVACPFEIPAYEFQEPLKPVVRKCQFCTDREKGVGANPACAAACPTEALVFGKRAELVTLARERLDKRPDRYINYIYGEKELGGTSWLYLAGRPTAEIKLLPMPDTAPAQLTEAIQHGIFKYGILPIAFYGLLGGVMWYNHRREGVENSESNHPPESKAGGGINGGGR